MTKVLMLWPSFNAALNLNPVLLARHLKYRVEIFFKVIAIDGLFGKVKIIPQGLNFKFMEVHMFIGSCD